MVRQSILAEDDEDEAAPLGIVVGGEVEGDGDEGTDVEDGDSLYMKRRCGGLLFLKDERKINSLLETAFLVEASPFSSLLFEKASVGLCLKASGLGVAEVLEFGGAEAIELLDFSGRHGVEDGAAIDEGSGERRMRRRLRIRRSAALRFAAMGMAERRCESATQRSSGEQGRRQGDSDG